MVSRAYGKGAVLLTVATPYHVGFQVVPGPSWDDGGFAYQNRVDGSPKGKRMIGRILELTEDNAKEWLRGLLWGYHGGPPVNGLHYGGWWKSRSIPVVWSIGGVLDPSHTKSSETFFYRAGDMGAYDCYLVPNQNIPAQKRLDMIFRERDVLLKVLDMADQMDIPHDPEDMPKPIQIDYIRKQTMSFLDSGIKILLDEAAGKPMDSLDPHAWALVNTTVHNSGINKDIENAERMRSKKVRRV